MEPISAVEAIAPAIELTRQRMFRPARFAMWWRIAIIGVLCGEFGSGGGGFRYMIPPVGGGDHHDKLLSTPPDWHAIFLVASLAAIFLFFLALAFVYIGSVMRFQLFDATLQGRYQIREGWRFWRYRAVPFFRLNVWILVAAFAGLAAFGGVPATFVYSLTGGFRHWNPAAILPILLGVLLLLFYFVALAVFGVFSKDFLVPIIALEGLGYSEAWSKLRALMAPRKGEYAIYILMKIVVALGGSLLAGLISVAVILALGIPMAILGFVVYLLFSASLHGALGIFLLAFGAVLFGFLVMIAVTTLCSPLPIFYTAFAMFFFAHRYPPLWNAMFPPPQAPPPIDPQPAPAF